MTALPTVLVCVRVEDHPRPSVPSDRVICARCLADVWRSQRGRWWVGEVICLRCAIDAPTDEEEVELEPAPWVRDDLVDQPAIDREGRRRMLD